MLAPRSRLLLQLLHGCPDPIRVDHRARPRRSGLGQKDERDPVGGALLVAGERREHLVHVHVGRELGRQAVACEQRANLLAQVVGIGEPQGGQQTEADRLAVAVARVAAGGLDRVAGGVAEVEDLAQARVALVGGDDVELGAAQAKITSSSDAGSSSSIARTVSQSPPPAISAVLITSTNPAASSASASVESSEGSVSTAAGRW